MVRSQLPGLDEVGRSKDIAIYVKILMTREAQNKYTCKSKLAVYLIECEIWGEQYTGYTGSTKTKFRSRANNYKSMQRKFVTQRGSSEASPKTKTFS